MLEFWLSPTNLSKDRFLTNSMLRGDGWVPVSLFVGFNKVEAIQATETDVLAGLRGLHAPPLEFSTYEDRTKRVRIAGGLAELKRLIDGVRADEDERTIYVETLPADATREHLTETFKHFGEVAYVSVPRFPGGKCKGFGFVEFRDAEAADKALTSVREGKFEVPRFPALRALPRAEWRRRKERYKDERRVNLAAARAKTGDASSSHAHRSSRDAELQTSVRIPNPDTTTAYARTTYDEPQQPTHKSKKGTSKKALEPPTPRPEAMDNSPDVDEKRQDPTDEAADEDKTDEIEAVPEPPLPFEHGLVVSISGLDKAKKKATRRALFQSLGGYGPVAYVDYSPRTPDMCKARFGSVTSAQAAVAALAPSGGGTILSAVVTASILGGEAERAYWASIHSRREARKKRKLDKAAENAAGKAERRVQPRLQPGRAGKGS